MIVLGLPVRRVIDDGGDGEGGGDVAPGVEVHLVEAGDPAREHEVGRALVAAVLAARFGLAGARIAAPPEGGKPRLEGRPRGPFFNIAHSGGAVVVAVAADRDVGVDIERIRPVSRDLEEAALGARERETVAAAAAAGDDAAFFRLWTAKEAFMKLEGAGLAIPPRALRVDLGRRLVLDVRTGVRRPFASARDGPLVIAWMAGAPASSAP